MSRKIVFPTLATSEYFQKDLDSQIVENKEKNGTLYKAHRMKLMGVLGFYMRHLLITL